jgi:hypothetical protein
MAVRIPSTRAGLLRLGLGSLAAVVALMVGLSGMPASADRTDFAFDWNSRHHQDWAAHSQADPYARGPYGSYRHPAAACGTNTVVGAAFGAGIGGLIGSQLSDRPNDAGPTVLGMLLGAILGGALGQSADRANGC